VTTYQFPHHYVEVRPDERLVITYLKDGKQAHACPHDTDDYRQHADRSGVGHDVDRYCEDHDLAHVWFGENVCNGESPVMRHVANDHVSGYSSDQLDREEEIVKALQAYFNRYGWPSELNRARP
jgi:hypothetical protein